MGMQTYEPSGCEKSSVGRSPARTQKPTYEERLVLRPAIATVCFAKRRVATCRKTRSDETVARVTDPGNGADFIAD